MFSTYYGAAVRFRGRIWTDDIEQHLDCLHTMLTDLSGGDPAEWYRLLDAFVLEGEFGWLDGPEFHPAKPDDIHPKSWRMAESGWIGDVRSHGPQLDAAALILPELDDLVPQP